MFAFIFNIITLMTCSHIFVSDWDFDNRIGNGMNRVDLDLEPGDILYRPTLGNRNYDHYGVYVGRDDVIHLVDTGIFKQSIHEFAANYRVSIKR